MSKRFEPIFEAHLDWKNGLPYAHDFQDVYFTESGLEESLHVFIEGNRLRERLAAFGPNDSAWPHFVIAETGFGTGLNFLIAIQIFQQHAQQGAQLHYFSVEKHPLSWAHLADVMLLWPALRSESNALLKHYPKIHTPGFHHCAFDGNRIFLNLLFGDAVAMFDQLCLTKDAYFEKDCRDWFVHAWFLDGFAPSKNQAMWSDALFSCIAQLSQHGSTLATFTVAGWVRRALARVGFNVKKCKGFGQKREMSTGTFEKQLNGISKPCTPWHISKQRDFSEKKAMVLGAGLAGCFVAHELAKLGWEVTLIDERPHEALQASNNPQAVLYPNLSIYDAPLTDLMLHAYTYALRIYTPWINEGVVEGDLSGMLQLATTEQILAYHASLASWLSFYPLLGALVNAEEASALAGTSCLSPGLFLPCSGWVNMKSLCAFLIDSPRIHCFFNEKIETIKSTISGHWEVGRFSAPTLVIAAGHTSSLFPETNPYDLFSFKGQMTGIEPTSWSLNLKIPLCADGHITPQHQNLHWVGATYHQGETKLDCSAEDDAVNVARYQRLASSKEAVQVVEHWGGIRASSRDHLPWVGAVPDLGSWQTTFEGLRTNRLRFIPRLASFYEGLYLCAGFGSRGLTTVPWSAAYLAALIDKKPFPCARKMAQSLSPARAGFRAFSSS